MFKGLCPHCHAEPNYVVVHRHEDVKVRECTLRIEAEFLKCNECHGEFDDPSSDFDLMATAYDTYKIEKGLLRSSDIKSFRRKLDLTQRELCKLLGWGEVTLSRYENGQIQDESHDKALRMAMTSDGMSVLLKTLSVGSLAPEKIRKLERFCHFSKIGTQAVMGQILVVDDSSWKQRSRQTHPGSYLSTIENPATFKHHKEDNSREQKYEYCH